MPTTSSRRSASPGYPRCLDLTGTWKFTYTRSLDPGRPDVPDASAFSTTMPVPGFWDDHHERLQSTDWWSSADLTPAQTALTARRIYPEESAFETLRYLRGIGWYRRTFRLPAALTRGRPCTALLEFREVAYRARVWVNGAEAGSHLGSRSAFQMDISGLCGTGNELIVAVGNDKKETGEVPYHCGRCGGILGPVQLRVAGPGAVLDLFVRAGDDLQTVAWTAQLKLPSQARGLQLCWRIRSWKGGRVVARGQQPVEGRGETTIEWHERVPGIRPWSLAEPNLYVAEVELVHRGRTWDRFTRRFGLRKWSRDGHTLKLNGEPFYSRANCRSTHYPNHAGVPLDKQSYLDDAARMKQTGFNTMKFLKMAPTTACYEAADEIGMIVSPSTDFSRKLPKSEWDRGCRELGEMVRTLRHYPSVSIYCLSAEQICTERFLDLLSRLYESVKQQDTGSLVLACHGARGIEYGLDMLDEKVLGEPFWHHSDRMRRLAACSDVIGQYPEGMLSYMCPGRTTWRDVDVRAPVYARPMLSHEVGMKGTYLDLRNEKRYRHLFPPVYYQRTRRQLEQAGLLHKAEIYYRLSCRVQQVVRKYALEEIRLCRSLAGYEYLGDTDHYGIVQSYPCGFRDEFHVLKPGESPREIRRYQNDSVLLLDFKDRKRRTCWGGDPFQGTWTIAHHGDRPIARGTLAWQLRDGDKVLLSGRTIVDKIERGRVTQLARLDLRWPELTRPARLNLRGTLSGNGLRIANDWDFWVFPRREPPKVSARCDPGIRQRLQGRYPSLADRQKDAKLWITSEFAARHLAHIRRGGDVLLLGTEPFPTWSLVNPIATGHSSARFHQLGTIVHDHPIFRGFPHDGFGDWQFYPLLDGDSSCIHLADADWPFDPILEVISSDKHVRRQASIFEARVDGGRLFVFACDFDLAQPSAAFLLDSVMSYVQGARFKPKVRWEPGSLRKILSKPVKRSVARRSVACPVANKPPPCEGAANDRTWRRAAPLVSTLAATAGPVTEADDDYHAGAGAAARVGAADPAAKLDFSARLRLLHDRDFLYVAVEVTAVKYFPWRDNFGKPFSQPDSLCVEYSGMQYGIAPTTTSLVLMGHGAIRTDLRARASITKPSKSKLLYRAALPRALSDGSDADQPSAATSPECLDVDITVFHGEDVDRRTHSLPAIPFHLRLDLQA